MKENSTSASAAVYDCRIFQNLLRKAFSALHSVRIPQFREGFTTDIADLTDRGKGEIGRIMAGQNHILAGKKRGEREGPCPQITGPMHADGEKTNSDLFNLHKSLITLCMDTPQAASGHFIQ